MATTDTLVFVPDGELWTCTFSSPGPCVVQLVREANTPLDVLGGIPSMPPVTLLRRGGKYSKSEDNFLFNLDMPQGIEITIRSTSAVTSAMMYIGE